MMQDLFISRSSRLLQNWLQAFPEANLYSTVEKVELSKDTPCIFWLHTNADRQLWLTKNIDLIKKNYTQAIIVVLANVPELAEAKFALSQGAFGYCHAYSDAHVLNEVREVVSRGGIWLGQDFLLHLIGVGRQLVSSAPENVSATLNLLTPREQEVAQKVALGLSNKEVARELNITERTVKAHISSTFERLGIKDRLQLALILNDKSI